MSKSRLELDDFSLLRLSNEYDDGFQFTQAAQSTINLVMFGAHAGAVTSQQQL